MKNREKYREQILEWAVAPGRDICDFKRKEVLAHFGKEGCDGISCPWCAIMLDLWLDEEYEDPTKPEVDWSNVPVDTLVRVRDYEYCEWNLRYFKGIDKSNPEEKYEAWSNGATSKTADDSSNHWKYCELVEDEDGSNTVGKKFHNHCELCKYFHLEVQEGGGWLEICEVTGGQVIGSDEVLNKSDNCPFMEVEDGK